MVSPLFSTQAYGSSKQQACMDLMVKQQNCCAGLAGASDDVVSRRCCEVWSCYAWRCNRLAQAAVRGCYLPVGAACRRGSLCCHRLCCAVLGCLLPGVVGEDARQGGPGGVHFRAQAARWTGSQPQQAGEQQQQQHQLQREVAGVTYQTPHTTLQTRCSSGTDTGR
jgi:hypothetical protein